MRVSHPRQFSSTPESCHTAISMNADNPENYPVSAPVTPTAVRYEYSPTLVEILQHQRLSILISTYQSGQVLVLGTHANALKVSFLNFERPMGIAASGQKIAIGSGSAVHFLTARHAAAPTVPPAGSFDTCFVPHTARHTGCIMGHDLGWGREGLWIVNTLFSCLCTLDDDHSFVPRWTPGFITQLAEEDRCHLNGLAMADGEPAYVTALAETDTAAGWRANKTRTGCVIDVASARVLARGLCMPHSPRVDRHGRLFVLNSGEGAICRVDRGSGFVETIEKVPGYTRGLALHGQFAFVGMSLIRETNVFGGLPIGSAGPLRCGLAVIDLISGRTVARFEFLNAVEEIFAVECLPNCLNPAIGGARHGDDQREIWVVPQSAAVLPLRLK